MQIIAARRMKTKLADYQQQLDMDQARLDDQLDHLSATFGALSQQALRQNNESFLSLARQSFEQLRSSAVNDLQAREQSFANLVKPIEKAIRETDAQLKEFDTRRQVGDAKLGEHLNNLLASQHTLQAETRNLVTALRRPEVRGQWGELTLKRLVELSGMSEHCDFTEQASHNTDQGQIRPDMLIHLPNNRQLVVDVKTPLDAYISATESNDEVQIQNHLGAHSKNLKQRIKELAAKQYWSQFERSPDFIILFVPGDQFLSSALESDPALLEFALERRILLATPTSLVGLLRAIAYGWSQDAVSKNSEQIKLLGETLYQRLSILVEHLNKLGANLDNSVEQFNRVVGSFQHKTAPALRKLAELGIANKHNDAEIELKHSKGNRTRHLNELEVDSTSQKEQT